MRAHAWGLILFVAGACGGCSAVHRHEQCTPDMQRQAGQVLGAQKAQQDVTAAQQARYNEMMKVAAEHQQHQDELMKVAAEQQQRQVELTHRLEEDIGRRERLTNRWEKQTARFDALLDKWEHASPGGTK